MGKVSLTDSAIRVKMRPLSGWIPDCDTGLDKIDLFGASPYIDALAIPCRTIHNDSQSRNALAVGVCALPESCDMGAFGNKKVLGPSNRSVSAFNVTHKSVTFPMVRCSFVKHPLPSYRDLSLWG